jgi:hypothetical protein
LKTRFHPLTTITYQQNCKITSGGCHDEKFFLLERWRMEFFCAMIMTIVYRSGVDNALKRRGMKEWWEDVLVY